MDCMVYLSKYGSNRRFYLSVNASETSRENAPAAGFSALASLMSQRKPIHNPTHRDEE